MHEQPRGDNFNARYMGNAQYLATATVVGWGSQPFISEYSRSGRLLLDGRLPGSDQTYRARRERWVGKPLTDPVGRGAAGGGKVTVYASWNGATEVDSWRVRAGAERDRMNRRVSTDGFETSIDVPGDYGRLQARGTRRQRPRDRLAR